MRLLGPLSVLHDGRELALPASRKVRALLGWLALAARPVARSRLCDLLWDVANDPRGELRWCLSKLRPLVDTTDRRRLQTAGDTVALRLDGCDIDALRVDADFAAGLAALPLDRLRTLATRFAGDFLEGLEIDRNPHFDAWLTARRRHYHSRHAAVLEQLADTLADNETAARPVFDRWIDLVPFDSRPHLALHALLMRHGRSAEAAEWLATTIRRFEAAGQDSGALHAPSQKSIVPVSSAPVANGLPALPIGDDPADPLPANKTRRASLAVMPFGDKAAPHFRGGVADGLTHDIITRLAKLRDFFVIARGSVYALAEQGIGPEEAGRRLKVDYVASGSVHCRDGRAVVRVELVEAATARIVWNDVFDRRLDDTFLVLDEICDSIVSSIAAGIETVERNRAILKTPNSLDAWEAYHRGLWHMYRFTQTENEAARHFFDLAIKLDPTFARAHAGLSFTHWQSAFQRWGDRQQETDRAFATAGQSLLIDDHNPAAHWAMGRALWLRGREDESLDELRRAVDLSPNFALGHYALSFVHSQSGDPGAAIESADQSRHLSPFDPLMFGMMGARAMAHVRLGQFEQAATWALKAAARPNAHVIILAIAAHCLALAGRLDEGRAFYATLRKTHPDYRADDFIGTFRFDPDAIALFRHAGRRIGIE